MPNRQKLISVILKIISSSQSPVGSGYIRDTLKLNGYDISEATVGRILRELDIKGYTNKMGFKGRSLTHSGEKYLHELEQENKINHYSNELINVIKVTGKKELLDILQARKIIESKMARLAAELITDKEINKLKEIINIQQKHVEEGNPVAEDDIKFHKLIAQAAGNKVLEVALDLIRQQGQISPMFEYIRKEVKSKVLLDHKNIFEAIVARNPLFAEKSMICHIENLEKDVKRYWEIVYNDLDNGNVSIN